MLRVDRLSSFYGRVQALREVSIEVPAGQAVGVLGPNGAGKSTLLHNISGLVRPRYGSIRYNDHELAGKTPTPSSSSASRRSPKAGVSSRN